MAKGAYIGVGGVARKVKKMYIGVNGVARKVKKAYIGVNGIARLFFTSDPAYSGMATPLIAPRTGIGGTASNPNYAIFAGGGYADSPDNTKSSSAVEAYNASLVRYDATALMQRMEQMAGASTGNYALFAGGVKIVDSGAAYDYNRYSYLHVYDTSLTRSVLTYAYALYGINSINFNGYAIFAGGITSDTNDGGNVTGHNYVYAYNSALTVTTLTGLNKSRYEIGVAKNTNYAMFVGGWYAEKDSYPQDDVEAYGTNFAHVSLPNLPAGDIVDGLSTAGYAMFQNGTSAWAYDNSLVKVDVPTFISKGSCIGVPVNDYSIKVGGVTGYGSGIVYYTDIYKYDASLVLTKIGDLPTGNYFGYYATVGSHILLTGGKDGKNVTVVDY